MYDIPQWLWAATAVRRPHAVGLAEAAAWSGFYIGVAVAFGFGLWAAAGPVAALEYYAGWGVEKSLSVDNLFVFVIIMSTFATPAEHEQKVLLFGITVALVMRMLFIMIGATAIHIFSPTFLLFGVLLLWTAVALFRYRNEDPDIEDNPLLRLTRRFLPVSTEFHGGRLIAKVDGGRWTHPLPAVPGVRRDR